MTVLTIVWGSGMIAESALCCVLVFTLTIPQYLIVNPIIGYVSMGILVAWTYWYARRRAIDTEPVPEQAASVREMEKS